MSDHNENAWHESIIIDIGRCLYYMDMDMRESSNETYVIEHDGWHILQFWYWDFLRFDFSIQLQLLAFVTINTFAHFRPVAASFFQTLKNNPGHSLSSLKMPHFEGILCWTRFKMRATEDVHKKKDRESRKEKECETFYEPLFRFDRLRYAFDTQRIAV